MMRLHSPGKYDDLAEFVRRVSGGSVVLIVMDGKDGHGIAVKATLDVMHRMPTLLREMADAWQADLDAGNRP